MAFDERGFVVRRYNEILSNIEDYQITEIQQKFKYQNNKLIYQLNSIHALSLDQVAQLTEAAFDSVRLSSAEGRNLEEIAFTRNVFRISASPSFTTSQYVVLEPGSIIPAGSLFSSSIVEFQATNPSRVVGDQLSCNEILVRINTVANNTEYKVKVNTIEYTYSSDIDATIAEIQTGLQAQFDADLTKTWSYVLDGGDGFLITADPSTFIAFVSSTTYIQPETVKVYFSIQLTETGLNSVPAGAMDTLVTSVDGFLSTNNDDDYSIGREQETDPELRLRIQQGGGSDCTGTVLTVTNSILSNVAGVTAVSVIENTDTAPVDGDGRPIGSYEVIVVGGTDEDVAQEVERTRPLGTPLFGNTNLFVVDPSGVSRYVSFSRPVAINVAIQIEYTLYLEETLPAGAEASMEDAVLDFINGLPLDKDVIPSRLFGPLYTAAVSGIDSITVSVQQITTPGDVPNPGSWQTTKLAIAAAEFASITSDDVYLVPL